MIIVHKDVLVHEEEDSEVYVKAGVYNSMEDFRMGSLEPDYPHIPMSGNWTPDYVGKTTNGNYLLAWDESYGMLYQGTPNNRNFTIK